MNGRLERLAHVLTDAVFINLAWVLYYYVRVRSGWIEVAIEPEFVLPMVVVYLYWAVVFFLVGLYRPWYAASRLDEILLVFKTTAVGCLALFFIIFVDDTGSSTGPSARVLIVVYWIILLACVGGGRLVLRSVQRRLLISGIGVHPTIIVGSPARARELHEQVAKYPALGFRVIGLVTLDRRRTEQRPGAPPVLGHSADLPEIIRRHGVREVLIALDSQDHARLLDVVGLSSGSSVGMKIVPDLYDIISGMARTNAIYGFPLIEISPQLLKPWEEAAKRGIDLAVAGFVLLAGLPLWLVISAAIKLDSHGPVLYKQERVGRNSEVFNMLKFRSMVHDAEKEGPRWASKRDPRITRVGGLLRRLHLDEVPQLINVLKGQMSLVGPRPERPVFVDELTHKIPMYPRRLRVRPGLTGWAQIKHKYDESVEDVRRKVQYDLYYIENISLRMDLKILLSTVSHMLMGKGH